MRDALSKFGEINELLWPLLEAAEVSDADRTTTSHTASEDISDSDQYITKAEDTSFEISRYLENHPALVSPVAPIAASASASARGHTISFRAMTHDHCRLWFMQLEDVFAAHGISSQTNKFAALTTLLTEEEAYVVRDLTMMGDERPSNVFDAAMSLFIKRYSPFTRDHTGIVYERPGGGRKTFTVDGPISARRGRVGPRRCRALGSPTPFASVITHYTGTAYTATINGRVVAKGSHTVVTLPSATVYAIAEIPTELAAAVTAGDIPAVNALFKRRDGHGGNGEKKKKQQQFWYHGKFGDESRCCSGPPCPRYRQDLPKCRTIESGNAKGSR